MINGFMAQVYLNNQVNDYVMSFLVFLLYLLILLLAKFIVVRRLKRWAENTVNTFDDFVILQVDKTIIPMLIFAAFYLSIKPLRVTPPVEKALLVVGTIFFTVMGLRFVLSLIDHAFGEIWRKRGDAGTARKESLKGILAVVKIVVSGIALVLLLDNLGVKISALVAGLGIGGVAIAFASQAVLGDLFSFFVILFDRPFEIGDFIVLDAFMGTVEHVGIKTTRIRSLNGEQLVFSNTDLTNSRLRNFKRMEKRRVAFTLGVVYQTPSRQSAEIPGLIKDIITAIPQTIFDRAHFKSFGDSALLYEVVYFVLNSDYTVYMDIQQEINIRIKQEFENRKIEFAYPMQTLYLAK